MMAFQLLQYAQEQGTDGQSISKRGHSIDGKASASPCSSQNGQIVVEILCSVILFSVILLSHLKPNSKIPGVFRNVFLEQYEAPASLCYLSILVVRPI